MVQNSDKIVHKTYRNESPIIDKEITIIHDDENLLAIDKPSSVPVHPCGNFMFNSVTKILELEKGIGGLKTCHRLDR